MDAAALVASLQQAVPDATFETAVTVDLHPTFYVARDHVAAVARALSWKRWSPLILPARFVSTARGLSAIRCLSSIFSISVQQCVNPHRYRLYRSSDPHVSW